MTKQKCCEPSPWTKEALEEPGFYGVVFVWGISSVMEITSDGNYYTTQSSTCWADSLSCVKHWSREPIRFPPKPEEE